METNHDLSRQKSNEHTLSEASNAPYSNSLTTLQPEETDIAADILAETNRVLVQSQGHYPRSEPEAPSETLLRAKSWAKDLTRHRVPAHLVEYLYLSSRDTRRDDPQKRSFPPSLDDLLAEWATYRKELYNTSRIEQTRRAVLAMTERERQAKQPAVPGSYKEKFMQKFGKAVLND